MFRLLLLINLNLPLTERVKPENMLCIGIVPGPELAIDLDSFLKPLIDELATLGEGVSCWHAERQSTFTLRAHLVLVTGDQSAMTKICGYRDPVSYNPCRMCSIRGIPDVGVNCCTLRAPDDTPDDVRKPDPGHLPVYTDDSFRTV